MNENNYLVPDIIPDTFTTETNLLDNILPEDISDIKSWLDVKKRLVQVRKDLAATIRRVKKKTASIDVFQSLGVSDEAIKLMLREKANLFLSQTSIIEVNAVLSIATSAKEIEYILHRIDELVDKKLLEDATIDECLERAAQLEVINGKMTAEEFGEYSKLNFYTQTYKKFKTTKEAAKRIRITEVGVRRVYDRLRKKFGWD